VDDARRVDVTVRSILLTAELKNGYFRIESTGPDRVAGMNELAQRYPPIGSISIAREVWGNNHDDRAYCAETWMPQITGDITHGTLDDNVPPRNTRFVVDALINANKDFDLLLLRINVMDTEMQ
jgi:hypothetical protein